MSLDPVQYYNERWRQFSYANLYCQERCIFILQALLDKGLREPRICDLGCGSGWLSGVLSAFGPVVGVELAPEAVELARVRYPGAEFVCADATQWQPEAGSFDVVVSQEVIEHIPDKKAYLAVARRALKTGGCLLMTTPNLDVLEAILKPEREAIWEIQPIELPLRRSELNSLLESAGFQVTGKSSVAGGMGKLGIHRLVNSHKLRTVLRSLGIERSWARFLLRHDFGMYMTTVARAV